MKTEYKVVFDDYSETKVSANTHFEAKILAQAKRIEAGKPFYIRSVECQDECGEYVSVSVAHLESMGR